MGCLIMPKGVPNKRYTPEFKELVVETMQKEKLSYKEAARQFNVCDDISLERRTTSIFQ